MTTYKYFCINDDCSNKKDQHIKRKKEGKELCPDCKQELKLLGIVTNISHIGTQESMNKMRR